MLPIIEKTLTLTLSLGKGEGTHSGFLSPSGERIKVRRQSSNEPCPSA